MTAFAAAMVGAAVFSTAPVWDKATACWLAQEVAPVGAAEADVRARLGEPCSVHASDFEGTLFGTRPISDHALLYSVDRTWWGNWIIVYIGEDGLVECAWATTTGSE